VPPRTQDRRSHQQGRLRPRRAGEFGSWPTCPALWYPTRIAPDLDDLAEAAVNEIFYSGTFRHLAADDRRSEPGRLWTTDAGLIPLEQAEAPHQAETRLAVRDRGTANALALWFTAELAPGIPLSIGPGDPPTHWGMTTAPLRQPVELTPGTIVRARVRTAPARPAGTWTS